MSATIKPALRGHLATISGVSGVAVVSIDRSSQSDVLPRVVVQRENYRNDETLEITTDDSLIFEDFRIECRGKTSQQAQEIAESITDSLQSLSGAVGSERNIVACTEIVKSDEYEIDEFGGDAGAGLVTITTTIIHTPQ